MSPDRAKLGNMDRDNVIDLEAYLKKRADAVIASHAQPILDKSDYERGLRESMLRHPASRSRRPPERG